ncbi:MAG TPA: AGE family epimerase/isomerase [Bryobacteraceae bacterium]|nr:AGE family epimerase/isomerase [Bryobacteraceae bacterium]
MKLLSLFLALLFPALAQDPASYITRLEHNLRDNIVAFWYPKSIDRVNGGYIISADADGVINPSASKTLVTQARQVWLFSRLAREGVRSKEMLEAAAHGFHFLRDKMWDQRYGGFYWEVDATGTRALKPGKHMYGQSFALYALSEYFEASKDPAALDLATRLFALFEQHAHDARYGGYLESFNRDWSAPPPGEPGYMEVPPDMKLMNTHLHLLESMTAYFRASHSPVARDRLIELIAIQSNAVVRKPLTACTDKYDRDWTPALGRNPAWDRVSYGHDLENIWLLTDAAQAAGIPVEPFLDLFRQLFAYSLKYGYDPAHGGFYDSGPFSQPATNRTKTWWVQAEASVSALYMYRLTHDRAYWDVFAKTCDFIDRYQTDWQTGEWWESVSEDLKPSGAKAHGWKAGYHTGRAMLECLRILREIRVGQDSSPAAGL